MSCLAFLVQVMRMEYFIHVVFEQLVNVGLIKARLIILIFAWIKSTGVIQDYHVKQQTEIVVLAV